MNLTQHQRPRAQKPIRLPTHLVHTDPPTHRPTEQQTPSTHPPTDPSTHPSTHLASSKELKEICAHEDCLAGAPRALYVKPSEVTLESHREAERGKQLLVEAHKPLPKLEGAKDTTSKTYWVYLKPTILRRQMATDNIEAVQRMAESATHVRHHMKQQVKLLQARKVLWETVSRDSHYVREYLGDLLAQKVADLHQHATAALIESDQTLAAACVGSYAQAKKAALKREELVAQTEELCEVHQRHIDTITTIIRKQGETAAADETYLEFVKSETKTILENHRGKVAALVANVDQALESREALVKAETDTTKAKIQAELMLKYGFDNKPEAKEAPPPPPPRDKRIARIPKRYERMLAEQMVRGPREKVGFLVES